MTLKEFKKTKWWEPALRRYDAHLKACKELECEELIVSFRKFIDEVMDPGISDAVRADMLAVEPLEEYVPFQRYPAYIEPTKQEQKLDFYGAEMGKKLR